MKQQISTLVASWASRGGVWGLLCSQNFDAQVGEAMAIPGPAESGSSVPQPQRLDLRADCVHWASAAHLASA